MRIIGSVIAGTTITLCVWGAMMISGGLYALLFVWGRTPGGLEAFLFQTWVKVLIIAPPFLGGVAAAVLASPHNARLALASGLASTFPVLLFLDAQRTTFRYAWSRYSDEMLLIAITWPLLGALGGFVTLVADKWISKTHRNNLEG